MKKISLATALLAVAMVVSVQAATLAERVEHWQQRLKNELSIGGSKDSVLEWVSKNQLRAQERPVGEIAVRLESFSPDPAEKCTRYQISATLKLDNNNRLESTAVKAAGNCF